jgi:hypothetical protein
MDQPMNEVFINTYIQVMNDKIAELMRNELMFTTRLTIAENAVRVLSDEKIALEKRLEDVKKKTKKDDSSF